MRFHRREAAAAAALIALVLGWPVHPSSASQGSRYLTLDQWAYEGITELRQAGYLRGLNPNVQPYRRAEVAREIGDLDPGTLPPNLAHWVRMLRAELGTDAGPGRPDTSWGMWIEGGGRGSTSDRMDPLRPLGSADHLWPYGRGGVGGTIGPLAGEMTLLGDRYLNDDPEGASPQRRVAHTQTAYVSAALPFGELMVGRIARNWSHLGTQGFMVGGSPVTYPQIGLEIRAGRFSFRSFLGELDTAGPTDSLAAHKRYLAAHRVDLTWPDADLFFGESILYAAERPGFSLRYLNPAEFFYFDSDAEPRDAIENLMLEIGGSWRRGGWEFYGEGLLDDVDLNPPKGADREPTSYAFLLGGRRRIGMAGGAVGVEYSQVGAWAYRAPNGVDGYTFLGRGLGAPFSDYDLMTVWTDLVTPWPGVRITPAASYLRQGEGNFLEPNPPYPQYLASPNLFLGTRENTVRLALRGRCQTARNYWIGWDAGVDFINNRDHVPGADVTSFSGTIEAGFRFQPVRER